MKLTKKAVTYLLIVGLALLSAMSNQLFIFSNRFAPAGINGICTMIQHIFGINVGYLSLIINIPLAIWTYFKVGRSLAVRSMLYVLAFSLFLIVLEKVDLSAFAYETANGTSKILGPLCAGLINGVVYSTLVRTSASSGGTDFVAAIIHKDRPELNFFYIVFSINGTITHPTQWKSSRFGKGDWPVTEVCSVSSLQLGFIPRRLQSRVCGGCSTASFLRWRCFASASASVT